MPFELPESPPSSPPSSPCCCCCPPKFPVDAGGSTVVAPTLSLGAVVVAAAAPVTPPLPGTKSTAFVDVAVSAIQLLLKPDAQAWCTIITFAYKWLTLSLPSGAKECSSPASAAATAPAEKSPWSSRSSVQVCSLDAAAVAVGAACCTQASCSTTYATQPVCAWQRTPQKSLKDKSTAAAVVAAAAAPAAVVVVARRRRAAVTSCHTGPTDSTTVSTVVATLLQGKFGTTIVVSLHEDTTWQ